MDLQLVGVDQFQNFLLCLSRVAALIAAIPVFAGNEMAGRLKIGISVATALMLFPLMDPYTPTLEFTWASFGLVLVNEAIIGLLLGLIATLVFTAVSFGGTVIGYQMGFAAANIFDPQTTQQLSLMSQFQNIIAMLIFLSLNIHNYFFQTIVESYILLPPGLLDFSAGAVDHLMHLGSEMFVLGVKFSAPVLCLLLLSNLVLGLLARVFPQLNVFLLSFPMNIGIAFLVIGLTLNTTLLLLRREFDNLQETFFLILQMLR
jgi:flagellar biosynthesis protein FliR